MTSTYLATGKGGLYLAVLIFISWKLDLVEDLAREAVSLQLVM